VALWVMAAGVAAWAVLRFVSRDTVRSQ
jgi:hypothetical protein